MEKHFTRCLDYGHRVVARCDDMVEFKPRSYNDICNPRIYPSIKRIGPIALSGGAAVFGGTVFKEICVLHCV